MGSDDQKTGPLTFVDRVCDEFERLWRSGRSPRIEEFLEGVAETDRVALALELIAVDVYFRRAADESPSAADYVSRFPHLELQIAHQFACESSASISRAGTALSHKFRRDRLISTISGTAPTAVGRYRLESLLGQGGFGEVWRGIDTELHRPVAVKLIRADRADTPQIVEAFISEGRKLAQLRHPGVVTVFDVGEAEGRCYIVSELVEGGTLAARLKGAALPGPDAALLVAKIADALHHAHLQGVIHRDIKPQNILLTESGEPKLADFGLAANEEDQLTEPPAVMGTLAYMAPEAVRGASHRTDARADIYGLGIVLYQALTGRLPFVAHSPEQYREQILDREPRPPRTIDDQISPELERICLKCLSKAVSARYTTAADLARELRNAVVPQQIAPAPAVKSTPKVVPGIVILLMLALGVALSPALVSYFAPSPVVVSNTPPEEPPDVKWDPDSLPYDESTLGFQPVAFEWHDLLSGPKPGLLDWPSRDSTSLLLHNRERSELKIGRTGRGMLTLGRTTEPGYVIQMDLFQNDWSGNIGVFFGFHAVDETGDATQAGVPDQERQRTVRYQTVRFDKSATAGQVLRRRLITEVGFGTANSQVQTQQLGQSVVKRPTSKPVSLELEITQTKLRIRWGGTELEELSLDPQQIVQPADQVGEFGVFLFSTDGIIRNARLMRRFSPD